MSCFWILRLFPVFAVTRDAFPNAWLGFGLFPDTSQKWVTGSLWCPWVVSASHLPGVQRCKLGLLCGAHAFDIGTQWPHVATLHMWAIARRGKCWFCEKSAEIGPELVALHAISLKSAPSKQKRGTLLNAPWCCGPMNGQSSTRGWVWVFGVLGKLVCPVLCMSGSCIWRYLCKWESWHHCHYSGIY